MTNTLCPDILDKIFPLLGRRSIYFSAGVCKKWAMHALPVLYRNFVVSSDETYTILLKNIPNVCSVVGYTYGEMIRSLDIDAKKWKRGGRPNLSIDETDIEVIVKSCPSLESLTLWDPSSVILGKAMEFIAGNCHRLRVLRLCGKKSVHTYDNIGSLVAQIGHGLERLLLRFPNAITESLARTIYSHCPKITSLDIVWIDYVINETMIDYIVSCCANIESLSVGHSCETKVSVRDLGYLIRSIRGLKELDVENIHITTDDDICEIGSAIASCSTLQKLRWSPKQLTPAVIGRICEKNRNLRVLTLANCNVRDSVIIEIVRNCPLLTHLAFWNSSLLVVTDRGIKCIANGLPKLISLLIGKTVTVFEEAITLLTIKCPDIQELYIYCTFIKESVVYSIAKNCKNLRKLRIGDNIVTNSALKTISAHCRELEYLKLTNGKISRRALKKVISSCNNLEVLKLINCDVDTDGFEKKYPNVSFTIE